MSIRDYGRPKGSAWRKKAFKALVARDGETCQRCGTAGRTIWRSQGVYNGDQWGPDPWERSRFTIVYPSSNLEVDHRCALSDGGTNDHDNLHLLCIDCHKRKTSAECSSRLKRMFAEARA